MYDKDMIIQRKIDEALDEIMMEFDIWIDYSWDYKEVEEL